MGKQSARLYYQGKDHKDIYFNGNYHVKMYKASELVWEKLYPDEFFIYSINGIDFIDIKNKFVDTFPTIINGRKGVLENFLFIQNNIISLIGSGKIVTSKDAEKWNIQNTGRQHYYISRIVRSGSTGTVRPYINTFPYGVKAKNTVLFYGNGIDDPNYYILKIDENGNYVEEIKTKYSYYDTEGSYWVVGGTNDYYCFYRQEHVDGNTVYDNKVVFYTYDVDTGGNNEVVKKYELAIRGNNEANYRFLKDNRPCLAINVGNTIYLIYLRMVVALNKHNLSVKIDSNIIDFSKFVFFKSIVLYSDETETVVAGLNSYEVGFSNASYPIYIVSFKDGISEIVNRIDNCLSIYNISLKENVNVGFDLIPRENYGIEIKPYDITIRISEDRVYQKYVYIKNKKLDIKKENGLWLYAVEMSTEKECAIYFDNLYMKESPNNFIAYYPILED